MSASISSMTSAEPALRLTGVTVRFGGVTALSDVSLAFPAEPGISAIIGPNGAGKTTLFNVMTGIVRPLTGRVVIGGLDVTGWRPDSIFRAGLARTFQGVRLFEHLEALQNVELASRSTFGSDGRGGLAAWFDRTGSSAARARDALDSVELDTAVWHELPERLTLLQRRQVEIARALTGAPRALLLDEPAAGLNTAEKEWLQRLLLRLADRHSCRIVLVEHDMKLVMSMAERITVLNFGRLLCEGTPVEIRENPAVIDAYLGTGETDG